MPVSNEYLVFTCKIGVDTAENEPLEVWGKMIQTIFFIRVLTHESNVRHPAVAIVLLITLVRKPFVTFRGAF